MNIDLNCDMGEGMGNDALIMPFISSANIACGAHAGDPLIIQETIQIAKKYNVAVGAHPSYPDKANFGRVAMNLSETDLYEQMIDQIQLIKKIAEVENTVLHHVKPHGALYNTAANDKKVATIIAKAVYDVDADLKVYGLPNSVFQRVCIENGLQFVGEGFADRTYTDEGLLTPRSDSNALITDSFSSIEQVMNMILKNAIKSTSGKWVEMSVKTICIHGDGKDAVEFAKTIHDALKQNMISLTTKESI